MINPRAQALGSATGSITVRAYIATKAMAAYIGLADNSECGVTARSDEETCARWAVAHADALIAELNKAED